ncbi:MAG: bifunctional nuclease family protein [Fimbriimonadaceae bacterium]
MAEDRFEDQDDLNRPPSFFPYDGDAPDMEEDIEPGEPVECQVEAVFATHTDENIQRFVLLSDGRRKLPIVIGAFEASAITMALEGLQADRPMTHDLLKNIIEKLDATVDRILIDDMFNDTYYAKIWIVDGEDTYPIDSRPSDAIAIALRFNAPILVSDGILEANSQ